MNPIPILHDDFRVSLTDILRATGIATARVEKLHQWYRMNELPERVKTLVFPLSLATWGLHWSDHEKHNATTALWECYFPDTRPHIYHYLSAVLFYDNETLAAWAELTPTTIAKILKQPKLHKRQLRVIAPAVIEMVETMRNPRAGGGVDSRYMILHRALKDPARVYTKDEITTD